MEGSKACVKEKNINQYNDVSFLSNDRFLSGLRYSNNIVFSAYFKKTVTLLLLKYCKSYLLQSKNKSLMKKCYVDWL